MKKNGIDASKVKIENVGFPAREPMLVQGKVDAITGENPTIVQGFVRATIRGFMDAMSDQKDATATLMMRDNILNDGQEFVRLKMALNPTRSRLRCLPMVSAALMQSV